MTSMSEGIRQVPENESVIKERRKLSSISELNVYLAGREEVFFARLKEVAESLRKTCGSNKSDVGYTLITRVTGLFTGKNLCNIVSNHMFSALSKLVDPDRIEIQQVTLLVLDCLHEILTATDITTSEIELIDPTYGQYKPLSHAGKILLTPFKNLEFLYPTDYRKRIDIVRRTPRGFGNNFPESILPALTNLERSLF